MSCPSFSRQKIFLRSFPKKKLFFQCCFGKKNIKGERKKFTWPKNSLTIPLDHRYTRWFEFDDTLVEGYYPHTHTQNPKTKLKMTAISNGNWWSENLFEGAPPNPNMPKFFCALLKIYIFIANLCSWKDSLQKRFRKGNHRMMKGGHINQKYNWLDFQNII